MKNTDLDTEIKKKLGSITPWFILKQWLHKAKICTHYKEPWAMVLSSYAKRKVNSRVVLLKELQKSKLVFYTNYLSSKGKEIKSNPFVAINFYWPHWNRQIRIQGTVKKTSRKKSLNYWKTRSQQSQISQWISSQSQPLKSEKELQILKEKAKKKFLGRPLPCPKNWGGYTVQIQKIEFWIEKKHRLHDRFLFEKHGKIWKKQRLFP